MFLKKRKFYTLSDIRKQLVFTPLVFVFISSALSIIVIIFILEFNKNNEIKLFSQEETFNQKLILNQYVDDIKSTASAAFDKEEFSLNQAVLQLSGYIKYANEDIDFKSLKSELKSIEEHTNLEFVIFDKTSFNIFYGENIINYLKVITNSKLELSNFQYHMLKSILYIGDDNLIYWIDNQKNKIRLSYFKNIENKNWFLGAFSKIDDMKDSTRDAILNSIVQKSKYYSESYFWFYDYDLGYVYNYYNKGQRLNAKYILEKDRLNSSNEILRKYKKNEDVQKSSNIYNFTKYNFLVSVKSYAFPSKVSTLEYEYNSKLSIAIAIVMLIAFFLIVASIIFSKFINKIFHRYNKRLETKNILYKKWKDRYELAIIASNDGLWDIDLKTKQIYFSRKWLDMFGYKNGDVNTLDEWLDLIHVDDRESVEKRLKEHFKGKSDHYIAEYRIKDKSNNYKWILVRGKAFEDKERKLKRMLMMSMDIEQRKKLTKELQYVDLLVEYGRIVIFKWKNDEEFSVQYTSKSINSYGYDVDDFEKGNIKYFEFIHEDDLENFKNDIQEAIRNDKKSFTQVHRVKDKDGEIRWVFNRTIFLKDDFGNITHLYGYINDITRMKLHEEELTLKIQDEVAKNTEKDRLLVHQSKLAAMGEMLGNIAHQWRQPLNNINLLTHFIRDNYGELSKNELDDIIKDTKIQIDYMSQTIDDFRNFYQPTKDKIKFDIKEAIIQSSKIIDTQFEESGIILNILGDEIETVNYKNEFQQVILNILNNASDAAIIKKKTIDFSPEVNIIIEKERDDLAIIKLSNNCGEVSPKIKERMFEPYFTTKFENQGTGIGLYMAKTIIEKNMNGNINVKNIKDGITFIINLPL
ncbi:PAS domain-containing protein [Arcobacter sp. LA11]|uniref:PAS domain-containing protein n=1 Tax=Arcobacter sp. LA11 TaxID=1898176 RepID=UPI000932D31D|nr:PAS domain-containing protein [Arcobacter sp. LA11]